MIGFLKENPATSTNMLGKGGPVEKIRVGTWELMADEARQLTQRHLDSLTALTARWAAFEVKARREDPTPVWVLQHYGVPTLLCRVDMIPFSPDEDPARCIFEIESRPAGFGLLVSLNPAMGATVSPLFAPVGPIGALVLPSRAEAAEDTRLMAQGLGWEWLSPEAIPQKPTALWVRGSHIDTADLSALEARAVAPLTAHGDKAYLVDMGLAEPADPGNLPWGEPFVLKPLRGSKGQDVMIWHPERKKTQGVHTRTKIEGVIGNAPPGSFLCQRFLLPQEESFDARDGFTIWRIFFAYDLQAQVWRFAGGVWLWRPALKVHGARDSVVGLLTAE